MVLRPISLFEDNDAPGDEPLPRPARIVIDAREEAWAPEPAAGATPPPPPSPVPETGNVPAPPEGESTPREAWRAGTKLLDRYLVIGRLGRGGMGMGYRVFDPELQCEFTAKTLLPGCAESFIRHRETARREILRLRQFAHPRLAQIEGLLEEGGHVYLLSEYVAGESLARQLARKPIWSENEIHRIMEPILDGLAALHARGLAHLALKPENVLAARDGAAKLSDFAATPLLATLAAADGRPPPLAGNPLWMAPEQFGGLGDARSDVYAVGLLLHRLLWGRPPFPDDPAQTPDERRREAIAWHLGPEWRPPARRTPEWDAVLARCLRRAPAARFAGAGEVLAALRRCPVGTRAAGGRPEEDEAAARARAGAAQALAAEVDGARRCLAEKRYPSAKRRFDAILENRDDECQDAWLGLAEIHMATRQADFVAPELLARLEYALTGPVDLTVETASSVYAFAGRIALELRQKQPLPVEADASGKTEIVNPADAPDGHRLIADSLKTVSPNGFDPPKAGREIVRVQTALLEVLAFTAARTKVAGLLAMSTSLAGEFARGVRGLAPDGEVFRFAGTPPEIAAAAKVLRELRAAGDPRFAASERRRGADGEAADAATARQELAEWHVVATNGKKAGPFAWEELAPVLAYNGGGNAWVMSAETERRWRKAAEVPCLARLLPEESWGRLFVRIGRDGADGPDDADAQYAVWMNDDIRLGVIGRRERMPLAFRSAPGRLGIKVLGGRKRWSFAVDLLPGKYEIRLAMSLDGRVERCECLPVTGIAAVNDDWDGL